MCERMSLFPLLLLAGLLIAAVAGAQIPDQSPEAVTASKAAFLLRAGVVVDPAAERIYAMSAEAGIEALGFDGSVVWRSEAAARPLGMYGDLLIAQQAAGSVGEMSLAFLDRSGVDVGDASMRLASQAAASVVDGPHSRFDARSRIENGQPVVEWEYTRLRSGALLRPATMAIGATSPSGPAALGGEISFDPASGAQGIISSEPPSARAPQAQARPLASDFIPGALEAMFSVDRRHVLITERVAPGEPEEYRWSIFGAQTRSKIGGGPNRLGGASFFVDGMTLIFDSSPYTRLRDEGPEAHGLELMAMSLESGELMWARGIRDTRFYGPFPH